MVIAAMGSSTVVSYADEPAQTENAMVEPEQPVYENGEQFSAEDEVTFDLGELDEVKALDTTGTMREDVCFYIRKGIDSAIPQEPAIHLYSDYSDPIRIGETAYYGGDVVCNDEGDYQDAFLEDGFTFRNEVTASLLSLPGVEQIQQVAPEFDPNEHYILWYVLKRTVTLGEDYDVRMHVDGIIKTRKNSVYKYGEIQPEQPEDPQPEEPEEPLDPGESQIVEPIVETVSTDYTFNIYTTDLNNPEGIKYDGQEHLIGGYVIEVHDKESGALLTELKYGPYGNRLMRGLRASAGAEESLGTVFSFGDKVFRVNVDGAFMTVTEPGQYNIPFMLGGQPISADEIRIWDESGKLIDTGISKEPAKDKKPDEVKKRSITITAGTTVQNDNGQTLTNGNVTVTGDNLLEGHRVVTTILGSQTGPGTSLNEITDYDILDKDGKSVKQYYEVEIVNGKLVVVTVSGSSEQGTNSTGSATTSILVKDANKTVVKNVPVVLGATRDGETGESGTADNDGQVLGARRAETSDSTMNAGTRLTLIVLCLMMIMIINAKRNKTE